MNRAAGLSATRKTGISNNGIANWKAAAFGHVYGLAGQFMTHDPRIGQIGMAAFGDVGAVDSDPLDVHPRPGTSVLVLMATRSGGNSAQVRAPLFEHR
ncbi:MAG: hypothetical protein HoeaKO_38490 [Hoeflea alexandrii]